MKALTLISTLVLCATVAHAQTRLEEKFKQVEAAAVKVDKQKAETEAARAKAEQIRIRNEQIEKMRQAMSAKLNLVSAQIEAKYGVKEEQTIQTKVRHVILPIDQYQYHYVLRISQYSKGLICQIAALEQSGEGLFYSFSRFSLPVTCVSEQEGTSQLMFTSVGNEPALKSLTPNTSKEAILAADVFSEVEKMDVSQDKAKAAGYSVNAIGTCLMEQIESRSTIHRAIFDSSSSYNFFASELHDVRQALNDRSSLAKFKEKMPECFAH